MKYSFNIYLFYLFLFFSISSFAAEDDAQTNIDNEFAEFEIVDEPINKIKVEDDLNDEENEFIESTETVKEQAPDKEEFNFLADEDEFEHEEEKLSDSNQQTEENVKQSDSKPSDIKPLTFADVPSHFRSNWSSYQVESIALLIIILYVLNYIYGKSRNHSIALKWFADNRESLERQFALVGDDGTSTAGDEMGGHLIRETEFAYSIWSTGRVGCQGMLTQIKLSKRQDLLGVALNLVRPRPDKVTHKIDMDPNEMDSFVIIFGQRKSVQKSLKEMNDLASYVTEKKNFEKLQLPSSFCVFAEIAETVPAIIDATTIQFLRKCGDYVESIHISDQYSGPKQQDEQYSKLPETHSTLIFNYFLADTGDKAMNELLMNFAFYMLDKIRHYRLSKEGKMRADKKRQNVQENFLKLTHQQRQEAAQTRREEKTRERKQRVMEEENPERQKRLEKMEQKRDAKQKQPKIKQFKIK